MTNTNDIKIQRKIIFLEKNEMIHFEGGRITGTLWGDHFNGLQIEISRWCDGSMDMDVYLENRRGYIMSLHEITKIAYGPITGKYEELAEVVFNDK